MKLRHIRKTKPYPSPYRIGASVKVPEYMGPFGFMMDSVRINYKGSSQSGNPDHRVCMAHIRAEREAYLSKANP